MQIVLLIKQTYVHTADTSQWQYPSHSNAKPIKIIFYSTNLIIFGKNPSCLQYQLNVSDF